MGRADTYQHAHLLDDAEQNIGNSAILNPQIGPGGPLVLSGTLIPQNNPSRLIQLSGPSTKGQTTSIVVTASRIVGAQNPSPGLPGPITGIVEFGNGGRSTKVEFDVPVGPFIGRTTAADVANEPQDGGTIITVPTGVLRVYTRYDNLLISPPINFTNPTSLAQIQGQTLIGPGGPLVVTIPPNPPVVIPSEPVMTKAMSAYFSRHFCRAYKTINCYVGSAVLVSAVLAPNIEPIFYCLPAFAKTVKILRMPITSALTVTLNNGIRDVDQFAVAAGVSSATVPVDNHENIISIRSDAVRDTVTYLAFTCEVGV